MCETIVNYLPIPNFVFRYFHIINQYADSKNDYRWHCVILIMKLACVGSTSYYPKNLQRYTKIKNNNCKKECEFLSSVNRYYADGNSNY